MPKLIVTYNPNDGYHCADNLVSNVVYQTINEFYRINKEMGFDVGCKSIIKEFQSAVLRKEILATELVFCFEGALISVDYKGDFIGPLPKGF